MSFKVGDEIYCTSENPRYEGEGTIIETDDLHLTIRKSSNSMTYLTGAKDKDVILKSIYNSPLIKALGE